VVIIFLQLQNSSISAWFYACWASLQSKRNSYIEVMSVCYLVSAPEQTDVLSFTQHNSTESCYKNSNIRSFHPDLSPFHVKVINSSQILVSLKMRYLCLLLVGHFNLWSWAYFTHVLLPICTAQKLNKTFQLCSSLNHNIFH
jgi:hypothetical protein